MKAINSKLLIISLIIVFAAFLLFNKNTDTDNSKTESDNERNAILLFRESESVKKYCNFYIITINKPDNKPEFILQQEIQPYVNRGIIQSPSSGLWRYVSKGKDSSLFTFSIGQNPQSGKIRGNHPILCDKLFEYLLVTSMDYSGNTLFFSDGNTFNIDTGEWKDLNKYCRSDLEKNKLNENSPIRVEYLSEKSIAIQAVAIKDNISINQNNQNYSLNPGYIICLSPGSGSLKLKRSGFCPLEQWLILHPWIYPVSYDIEYSAIDNSIFFWDVDFDNAKKLNFHIKKWNFNSDSISNLHTLNMSDEHFWKQFNNRQMGETKNYLIKVCPDKDKSLLLFSYIEGLCLLDTQTGKVEFIYRDEGYNPVISAKWAGNGRNFAYLLKNGELYLYNISKQSNKLIENNTGNFDFVWIK